MNYLVILLSLALFYVIYIVSFALFANALGLTLYIVPATLLYFFIICVCIFFEQINDRYDKIKKDKEV